MRARLLCFTAPSPPEILKLGEARDDEIMSQQTGLDYVLDPKGGRDGDVSRTRFGLSIFQVKFAVGRGTCMRVIAVRIHAYTESIVLPIGFWCVLVLLSSCCFSCQSF